MASTKLCHQDPNPSMEYHQQEDIDQDYEPELDILSLCDLPIYSSESSGHDQDYNSKELRMNSSESSSFDEDEENFFEFFSEEWNISTKTTTTSISKFSSSPPNDEHFIFCGKIIPSKQSLSNIVPTTLELMKSTKNIIPEEISQEKKSSSSLNPWKSNSVIFRSKSKSRGKNVSDKNEASVPKVSIYTAPVKSKLLLVLFGLHPKIPNHTELMTDIRNRQSRHAPSTFFPVNGGGQELMAVRRRSSENGLWRFIKAATCFGGQPCGNDVV